MRNYPTVLVVAAVLGLPFIVRPVIASEIWIFAIFGLGLNLLLRVLQGGDRQVSITGC